MTPDPLLARLHDIVRRYVPIQHGSAGMEAELRAWGADVAIEYRLSHVDYYDSKLVNSKQAEIRARFGVTEKP